MPWSSATGDEPIDLSKRKCPSSRLNSVVSLLEQESFGDSPLLNKLSIDALATLNNQNSTDAQMAAAAFLLPKALTSLNAQQLQQLMLKQSRIYSCSNCQIEFHKQENYAVHKKYYCSATKQQQALLEAAGSSLNSLNNLNSFPALTNANLNHINSLNSLNSLNTQKQSPSTSIDDLDTAAPLLNSGPNSPQSIHSQTGQARTSAASNSTTLSLVDTLVSAANKKSSSSSSLAANNAKTSGCVSPSISNSPVGSPPSFGQLNASSANQAQPIYKHFCSKCGIRFTSKDNLHAHQTYYCGNNSTTGLNGAGLSSTITNFNSASGLTEVNCPKCESFILCWFNLHLVSHKTHPN